MFGVGDCIVDASSPYFDGISPHRPDFLYHTSLWGVKHIVGLSPNTVFHLPPLPALCRHLSPFCCSRSHFLQLALIHIKQQTAILLPSSWNFDPIHKLAMHELQALNAHFPVTDDSNAIHAVVQVSDTKPRSSAILWLPKVFVVAQDDGVNGEQMVNCLAEIDVLALLKTVAKVDDFAEVEAVIGIAVGHSEDENEVVLREVWRRDDRKRSFWLWRGIDGV
jgi:hypothetical protein